MADAGVRTPTATWSPLLVAAGGLAATAYVALVEPTGEAAYPACPSWSVAGVLCPFCGCLRGVHAITNGDVIGMLSYNLLLPVVAILAIWGWARWAAVAVGTAWKPRALPTSRRFWWVSIAAAGAYGIVRNLPWEPFTALAP